MSSVTENFPDISFIDNQGVDDILTQIISDYQTKYKEITGKEVALAQADPYRLIMYACAMQIYQAMQYADRAGKMSFLKYAAGDYLDNLAALKGISRLEASAATTVISFSIDTPLETVVAIPAGCRVTNGNDIFFATDEYAEIAAGSTEVSVTATCTETGACGNGFAAGELNVIVNTLPYITAVANTSETTGGAETEDDDSLRDRIFNAPNSYSTAGPTGAYEYYTKLADATISDVVVKSNSAGVVDIYFVTEGGELPDEALLSKVEDYLNSRTIRPLTDTVKAHAPSTEAYDITLTYYIPSSSKSTVASIQENIASAVSAYNIWQTEKIGRDINPSYLIQKIMEAGAKRIIVTSPEYTVLSDDTIAKAGTATINYGGIEDD